MNSEVTTLTINYSIIVPVYNSTKSLHELHERLAKVFDETLETTFELILVDDASPNTDTWRTMETLQEKDVRVRIFQLMKNGGQHNATMCGLHQVRGRFVIMMDDDLQHPPEEIPKLITGLNEMIDCDAILGVAQLRRHATMRNFGSLIADKLIGMALSKPAHIKLSSFRLITRCLCDALIQYKGHVVTIGSLICMNTQRIGNVEIEHESRKYGRTGYSFPKLVTLALSNIFNFSPLPLKIISTTGFFFASLAMFYLLLILYQKITGRIGQAGFATIVILLSFYSGIILFSLGILGQYILRIMRTATSQQQFIVRRSRDAESDKQ